MVQNARKVGARVPDMTDGRMLRVAAAFARSSMTPGTGLCATCVDVLKVAGAGITVMGGDNSGPLCVSNDRMGALEDLQFTTGEGPCRDAVLSRLPVQATHMDANASTNWPSFVDLAIESGIGAVFAYPLSSNGVTVGVLTLYQDAAGPLSVSQHQDSLAVAEVLTETVLSLQDAAPAGNLAPGLVGAVTYRAQVHQAAGMVSIQLKVTIGEALARIRAYAYAHDCTVEAVAVDIVNRRLRLSDDRQREERGA